MDRERVAGADFTWFQMDRAENPMIITGLMWFRSVLTVDEVVGVLQERLVARYPKFAARVVREPGNRFSWEPMPDFDVRTHVHRMALPGQGGHAELEELVGQVMSTRLDPDRPLWHVDLVENVLGGSALVVRLHHVIADGISLARVMLQLADGAVVDSVRPRRKGSLMRTLGRAWNQGAHLLGDADRWRQAAVLGAKSAASVAHLLTLPKDPPSALHGTLGPRKVAAWLAPLELDRVKAVGRHLGGTVNDVLMAALALALRRYLLDRGTPVAHVTSFVPVNLRPLDRPVPQELGNQFGLVLLALPLDLEDPVACLAETKRRMQVIKDSPEAAVTYGILQALPEAPDRLEKALVDFFASKASLITTNVPGPREPLFLAGHEMAGILCWVPQSSDVALGISILSYCGKVRVGVAGDARVITDPHAITAAYAEAFEALEAQVG